MRNRPNILLIETDEQTFRTLSVYGHALCRTPTLDRLAGEGALFEHAYCAAPICVPSRVSMFSGQYPHVTGSLDNSVFFPEEAPNLIDPFREAGYLALLSGKNHCFKGAQLEQFDSVWQCSHQGPLRGENEDPAVEAAHEWIKQHGVWAACWGHAADPHPPEKLGTAQTIDHAVQFLEECSDRPFVLWCSIADPHTPIQAPGQYGTMYAPDQVPMPPWPEGEIEGKPVRQQIDYRALCGDTVTEDLARRVMAIYLGMNTYIDNEVGRLIARLDDLGLAENTIVVYTSDHGDYMTEHRMIRKSTAMYDCLWRVPLLIRWPGCVPSGQRIEGFASLVDLLPTLLDLCGLECPSEVQGRSFASGITQGTFEWPDAVFGETGVDGPSATLGELEEVPAGPLTPDFRPPMKLGSNVGHIAAIRTHQWKYVHDPADPGELYNMGDGPWELGNLVNEPEHEQVRDQLAGRLEGWLSGSGA